MGADYFGIKDGGRIYISVTTYDTAGRLKFNRKFILNKVDNDDRIYMDIYGDIRER